MQIVIFTLQTNTGFQGSTYKALRQYLKLKKSNWACDSMLWRSLLLVLIWKIFWEKQNYWNKTSHVDTEQVKKAAVLGQCRRDCRDLK